MLELAGSALLLLLLAGTVMSRHRQKPESCASFSATMERICDSVRKLWAIEDESRFGTLETISGNDQAEMRALCLRLIGDMLHNTCFIANRALPFLPPSGGTAGGESEDREGEGEFLAFQVVKLADRLILRCAGCSCG